MKLTRREVLTDSVAATRAIAEKRFVTVGGAYPAANARPWGVSRSEAASGEMMAVDLLGIAIVETTAAAIAAGAAVKVAADGRAVAQAGNGQIAGYAKTAGPAAGGFIEIFLTP